jgi:hypothetical protein
MDINKSCNLFLRDIYSYDIVSCHYTILENLGVDLSNIPKDEKETRNIKIGLLMRDNPKLTNVLRTVTNSTISEYILRNGLKDEDIILRQYDGIITTKPLKETTDRYIPLELRRLIQHMIISIDRDMYIAFDGNKTIVKGVPNSYEKMEEIYEKVVKINFLNKTGIFSAMQRLKNEIITSEDPFLYAIPENEHSYTIYMKKYGEIEISKPTIRLMDTNDIDKVKYFEYYLRPFFKSITKEFLK